MSNKGKHKHDFKGQAAIYCNADATGGTEGDEDWERERAVRKVVRTIIETHGGDGPTVKKDLEANYRRGIVWYKDDRMAEWKAEGDEKPDMKFLGPGVRYEEAYRKHMRKA